MTRAFDLACLGRAAVDLYGEQLGSRLEDVATFAKYLGGSPANTAVGAARLGLRAAMLTRVGDEHNGRFVREALEREGVDTSQVSTDPKRLTALVFLAIADHGDFPHIFYRDRCADMAIGASNIDPAFIAKCGALLVSGTHLSQPVPRSACVRAIEAARAAHAKVILDIDYRPVLWGLVAPGEGASRYVASIDASLGLAPILPACDLIVGTEEEIRIAGGSAETMDALRVIRKASPALIVVKRGAEGCVAFPGKIPERLDEGIVHPGFAVEVFNSLGAGDAFMAGFLRGWLRGEPVAACCRMANACGAIVVSRHGCAPAMPTWAELQAFLARPVPPLRLREDRELDHLHRATTRPAVAPLLNVLAFDHRSQLEALASGQAEGPQRIAAFKSLVAQAFERVAQGRPGFGLLLDDRYGDAVLPRLTREGYWIARPVEEPGSIPLEFESGMNVGLHLRTWPASHVAKVLLFHRADDPVALRQSQLAKLGELAEACAATGHELLVEVIPPAQTPGDEFAVAQAVESIYQAEIRPDWWKLPPSASAASWQAIGETIETHDALCRGILVLGLESGMDALRESFAVAAQCPWVRGFAVGRSIFGDAAQAWFAGKASDAEVVDAVAARYREVIALWEDATGSSGATPRERLKERA